MGTEEATRQDAAIRSKMRHVLTLNDILKNWVTARCTHVSAENVVRRCRGVGQGRSISQLSVRSPWVGEKTGVRREGTG